MRSAIILRIDTLSGMPKPPASSQLQQHRFLLCNSEKGIQFQQEE
jgi:hypothetical protein